MFYKVRLFVISGDEKSYNNKPRLLDHIIVGKRVSAREIMTSYKVPVMMGECIYKNRDVCKGHIKNMYIDKKSLKKYGFQLFTLDEDYVDDNKITEDDLDKYIDEFENSEFKGYYDEIKDYKASKKRIKEKVKSVKGKYE